ncbi:hypothetical protein DFO55_105121 [Grimontella sp. AG753]|nr:hypothetical protein DFO55_105121 [Grimontella sp. AG753]
MRYTLSLRREYCIAGKEYIRLFLLRSKVT